MKAMEADFPWKENELDPDAMSLLVTMSPVATFSHI